MDKDTSVLGVVKCGCIICTNNSYIPCNRHTKNGLSKEEREEIVFEIAKSIFDEIVLEEVE